MILDKLAKKSLIHPPKWLISNTMYLTIMGSDAYGCSSGSSDVELAIVTPHEHETPHHKPLWILWKQLIGYDGVAEHLFHVERIPANHQFASSIEGLFQDSMLGKNIKQSWAKGGYYNKRQGD